jgi:hypothetical protein
MSAELKPFTRTRPQTPAEDEAVRRFYICELIFAAMREAVRQNPPAGPDRRLGREAGTRKVALSFVPVARDSDGKPRKRKKGEHTPARVKCGTRNVPVYEPVRVVDWSFVDARTARAWARLEVAVDLFVRGKVGVGLVKLEYKRCARAHSMWFCEGAQVPDPALPVEARF